MHGNSQAFLSGGGHGIRGGISADGCVVCGNGGYTDGSVGYFAGAGDDRGARHGDTVFLLCA